MEVSMVLERQTAPTQAPLTRDQVEACCRLHRRIRVRTDVIRRLLEPDPARDEMMEVVRDLLIEIRGATEALETSEPDPHRPRASADSGLPRTHRQGGFVADHEKRLPGRGKPAKDARRARAAGARLRSN
jgi:hypothetical protein